MCYRNGYVFLTLILLFGLQLEAQTTIKVDSIFLDSVSIGNECEDSIYINIWVSQTGMVPGDTILINMYYGDGTMDSSAGIVQSWPPYGAGVILQHTYRIPGIFNIKAVAIGPGGIKDSLTMKNFFNFKTAVELPERFISIKTTIAPTMSAICL